MRNQTDARKLQLGRQFRTCTPEEPYMNRHNYDLGTSLICLFFLFVVIMHTKYFIATAHDFMLTFSNAKKMRVTHYHFISGLKSQSCEEKFRAIVDWIRS